ncbi:MAG: SusE domain-containing protein [Bacteroidota bacterium]|nr:SusE domain-containing protein [Bacteroidota bacterium]MDP4214972.1 SusE domain-containing protein [Bacteroidota bacterium]MDP4244651.1 SusE domain-containing protein [Bacteroidota bacterium]MDP4254992.1 SusE domain-containing protein [Bacteroidota bacterium]MDP4258653.1 SusE domain-containing protein [Bacteroidota bacterium]
MKRLIRTFLLIAAPGLLLLASCKKDEAKVYFTGGTAPVLKASLSDSIPLPSTDTTATAVTFTWTNPNYQFNTGVSSMNVTYYIQFDTTPSFNSSHYAAVSISPDLSKTFTVAELNALFSNGMLLKADQKHTVLVRVESFIQPYTSASALAAPLFSSVMTFSVTPFSPPPAVPPPSSGTLFLIGDATPESPQWDNSPNLASQQFTKVSSTEFKITIALTGGKSYLFIPVDNGDWSHKYGGSTDGTTAPGALLVDGKVPGANTPAPGASGTYTIDVNFQTGKYTVTPQ